MMSEALSALSSPTLHLAEHEEEQADGVQVQEEISGGRWRDLDARMPGSSSMPSFPYSSDATFAGGGLSHSRSNTSTSFPSSSKHRSRPFPSSSSSSSHSRHRSTTSTPSSSTLSTPLRYRRDLLVGPSRGSSQSGGGEDVLFVSEKEEDEEDEPVQRMEESKGASLASMLESTARSFGITLEK